MNVETIMAPVVVGIADDDQDRLLAAGQANDGGCRHVRTQSVGTGRSIVELDCDPDAVARVVSTFRSQGFAAVAGPPRPGYEVVWARRNAPYFYRDDACVCLPWAPFDRTEASTVIEINPGSGFGSGNHPSTVLVLRRLATFDLHGARVLDVGCGTGVLAIAAALGGAHEVVGVDTAEAAVVATKANAGRNGVGDRLRVVDADLALIDDPFDVVVANIHAPILIELAPQLRRLVRSGGPLVLSGLSPAQPSTVTAALRPMRTVWEDELDEWVALQLVE